MPLSSQTHMLPATYSPAEPQNGGRFSEKEKHRKEEKAGTPHLKEQQTDGSCAPASLRQIAPAMTVVSVPSGHLSKPSRLLLHLFQSITHGHAECRPQARVGHADADVDGPRQQLIGPRQHAL